jgi:hypothetical protein
MKGLELTQLGWLSALGRGFFEILPRLFEAAFILFLTLVVVKITTGFFQLITGLASHPMTFIWMQAWQSLLWVSGLYFSGLRLGLDRDFTRGIMLILFVALLIAAIGMKWFQKTRGEYTRIRISNLEEGI